MDLKLEKRISRQGYSFAAGLDEAGRGPLAGPVVAAAVCVNLKFKIFNFKSNKNLKLVNDSKKLSAGQRENLYRILISHPGISYGVGTVSEKVIDKINILQATKLAMKKALAKLPKTDYLLIDGNFGIDASLPQQSIIKGDSKVFSIAAASIIAKVARDRIMDKLHEKFPQYGFDKHKGYGTKEHMGKIAEFGLCSSHRKTFWHSPQGEAGKVIHSQSNLF